jgi:hypothetical protein
MKLSEAPTRIIGIQVGELQLDLIRTGSQALKVRVAMYTDDGPVGFIDLGGLDPWSPKVIEAMRAFTDAIEEEALGLIFKVKAQGAETPQADEAVGPAQF